MRILTIGAGFTVLAVGVVLLPLPGPGWVVIFAALAILAREFTWARRALDRLKHSAGRTRDKFKK